LDIDDPSAIGTDLRIGDALESEKIFDLHRPLLIGGLSGRPCGSQKQNAESEPRAHKSVLSQVKCHPKDVAARLQRAFLLGVSSRARYKRGAPARLRRNQKNIRLCGF